jgi:hypothetical protein
VAVNWFIGIPLGLQYRSVRYGSFGSRDDADHRLKPH